jgi:hypothetical protein
MSTADSLALDDDGDDAESQWNVGRDMEHLGRHAARPRREPCCEPILARLASLDARHVQVLQFVYFQRSSAWLQTADVGLEVGLKFIATPLRAALSTDPYASATLEAASLLRAQGVALWESAVTAYEGRPAALPRPQGWYARVEPRVRYVYFIRGEGTGLVKIGVADDPRTRLRDLSIGSPVALTLLGQTPGNEAIERALHKRFAALRAHGEWFRETHELASFIAEVLGRSGAP